MTRDQQRAVLAYQFVAQIQRDQQENYKILVKDLGPHIIRSGLAVTISHLEREQKKRDMAATNLLANLQEAVQDLVPIQGNQTFPDQIRNLDLERYILATQEILKFAQWLKRAVESSF